MVSIKSLVQPSKNLEQVQAGKIYHQAGIRLWGEGAYKRPSIDGFNTTIVRVNFLHKN